MQPAAKQALEHERLWQDLQKRAVFGRTFGKLCDLQQPETPTRNSCVIFSQGKGGWHYSREWHQPVVQSGAIPN